MIHFGWLHWILPWLIPLAYVLPGERVLEQVEAARRRQPALHLVAEFSVEEGGVPVPVEADLHPSFGVRIEDAQGGRWLVRGGRLVAANRTEQPLWIPQLEPLVLPTRAELERWLAGVGIEWDVNELGRCGREDCFVLGGRTSPGQLWIDQESFEVRRVATGGGNESRFEEYRDSEGRRFPARFEVLSQGAQVAIWSVRNIYQSADLEQRDFSESWVRP